MLDAYGLSKEDFIENMKELQVGVSAGTGSSSTTTTTSSSGSGSLKAEAAAQKTIRARLTVRGFKDREKADVERYAGTSSKLSQKLLVSEAVRQKWDIITTDISKAFLQGLTYEELARGLDMLKAAIEAGDVGVSSMVRR